MSRVPENQTPGESVDYVLSWNDLVFYYWAHLALPATDVIFCNEQALGIVRGVCDEKAEIAVSPVGCRVLASFR